MCLSNVKQHSNTISHEHAEKQIRGRLYRVKILISHFSGGIISVTTTFCAMDGVHRSIHSKYSECEDYNEQREQAQRRANRCDSS